MGRRVVSKDTGMVMVWGIPGAGNRRIHGRRGGMGKAAKLKKSVNILF